MFDDWLFNNPGVFVTPFGIPATPTPLLPMLILLADVFKDMLLLIGF